MVVRGRDEGPSAQGSDASTTGGVSVPTARTAPRLAFTAPPSSACGEGDAAIASSRSDALCRGPWDE